MVEYITLVSWKPGMAPGNGTRNQEITANQFLGLRDVETPLTPTSENAKTTWSTARADQVAIFS